MFLHQFLFKQFSVRQDRCARPIWPRASPLILLEGTERRTWNESRETRRPERKLQNIKLGSKKRRFERDDLTLPLFVLILVVPILVWTFQKMCVFSHPLKDSILSSPPHFTDLWHLWLEITWNSWSIGSIKLSQNLICRYAISTVIQTNSFRQNEKPLGRRNEGYYPVAPSGDGGPATSAILAGPVALAVNHEQQAWPKYARFLKFH